MNRGKAFTIVEIVIVVTIIGILSGVGIVAYNGFQARSRASAVTAALTRANKKLEIYESNNGAYPAVGNLAAADVTDTSSVSYQYSLTSDGYCITATSGTVSYKMTQTAIPVAGGCAGHGVGGVAPIINYALNPNATSTTSGFGSAGSSQAPSTKSIATDQKHSGASAYKLAVTGSGQAGASARVATNSLRVNAGEKVSWSFWVYSTKAGTISPYTDCTKASDGTYGGGGSGGGLVTVPVNTWTKVTATHTPAIDMYVTQAGGYNLSVVAGDTVWFDEFMITKTSSAQNYADGDTTNWVWNGTANSASSTGPSV